MPDLRPMVNGSVDVEDAGSSVPGQTILASAVVQADGVKISGFNCTVSADGTGTKLVTIDSGYPTTAAQVLPVAAIYYPEGAIRRYSATISVEAPVDSDPQDAFIVRTESRLSGIDGDTAPTDLPFSIVFYTVPLTP